MQATISKTLLEKLFENPSPASGAHGFAIMTAEMFPTSAVFIDFLTESHSEEQVRLAKDILLRLAYGARTFPPNKLIFNLLEVESRLAGTAAKAPFNGRDHFVHLVNLYLLGLYVFWYHEAFHKKIVSQFEELVDHQDNRSRGERRYRAISHFVKAWRDFVLFHDLGYPWEVLDGTAEMARFIKPFSDSLRYSSKDGALYILSLLIALEGLQEDEMLKDFAADFKVYFRLRTKPNQDFFPTPEKEFLEEWQGAKRLPLSVDCSLWRLMKQLVPPADLLSVLEESESGNPVASSNAQLHRLLPKQSRISLDEDSDQIPLPGGMSIHLHGAARRAKYHWTHYVRDLDKHLASCSAELLGSASGATFRSFARSFLSGIQSKASVSDGLHFEDFAFSVYQRLLASIDFDLFDEGKSSDLAIYHRLLAGELHGQKGLLFTEISTAIRLLLEAKAKELETLEDPITPTTVPLEEYLEVLFEELDERTELARQVKEKLSERIKTRVKEKKDLVGFYKILKEKIAKVLPDSFETVFPRFSEETPTGIVANPRWSVFKAHRFAASLENVFKQRGLTGLDCLESYRPPYAGMSSGPPFVDHGIASALLLAQIQDSWGRVLETADNPLRNLLNLRGGSDEVDAEHSSVVAHEVIYTIFVHNLYPKFFSDPQNSHFRTKFNKHQAFTYFALLCDSLQPWDRKRLFNQATGVPPHTTYAEHFNIEIVGDVFRISERGDRLRIEEREAGLRRYLNDYLDSASQLVRLRLAEWKSG